jgi:peptidoglycan/LPS O-acetylase OafA/YrhL
VFKLQYFLAGILVFRVLSADAGIRSQAALVACAVFLVSLEFEYGKQLPVLPVLLLSMLLLGWLESRGRTPAWLSSVVGSRVVQFASDTSYGVYLFHGFFLSASGLILASHPDLAALPPPQRVLLIMLFVATCAYLFGYAVYRWVEQPGIRLGRKVILRLDPARSASGAAVGT